MEQLASVCLHCHSIESERKFNWTLLIKAEPIFSLDIEKWSAFTPWRVTWDLHGYFLSLSGDLKCSVTPKPFRHYKNISSFESPCYHSLRSCTWCWWGRPGRHVVHTTLVTLTRLFCPGCWGCVGEAWSWPGEVRPLLRLEMEDVGVRREEGVARCPPAM